MLSKLCRGAVVAAVLAGLAVLAWTGDKFLGRPAEVRCEVLAGHSGWVSTLAFSPDGTLLACGGDYGGVRGEVVVWDVAARCPRSRLALGSVTVRTVAFSPDGRTLATGGDGVARLWDAATWRPVGDLPPRGPIAHAVFAPAGRALEVFAYGLTSDDTAARDAFSGGEVRWHRGGVTVAVSADGRLLAGDADGGRAVAVRRLPDGPDRPLPRAGDCPVTALAFTPDARTLFAGTFGGGLEVWDATTLELVRTARPHEEPVNALAVSPDGRVLATAGNDRTVGLWDAATLEPLAVLEGHSGAVLGVAFSPDGRRLATGSFDKTVRVWDLTALPRR